MSEKAGIKITPLSNSNYASWSGEMKEHPKQDAAKQEEWDTRADKAGGLLTLEQRVHIRGKEDNPVKLWKALEAVHIEKRAD
ncbi:hypothetical protein BJ138DRAFT_1120128 [Hygrophoropsis aurantiaca]|uniref:Uncharacterized protein n=1 Tax=Hygrophoropsis aurantiaca TaxID=72124 RepID=A0ACB7ZSM3_9AGAM|nr:hypothetical protein BJ138DRAFT_1120128 [Hygrophoropsis aurantiaca]